MIKNSRVKKGASRIVYRSIDHIILIVVVDVVVGTDAIVVF